MKKTIFLLTFIAAAFFAGAAEPAPAPAVAPAEAPKPKLKTFLIVLRPATRLYDEKAWTDADKAATGAHFQRLKAATDAGQVIMAGRTHEDLDKTQGLVVFTAADETAAREFMNADPCVVAGVMTATLHPYDLVLLRKN